MVIFSQLKKYKKLREITSVANDGISHNNEYNAKIWKNKNGEPKIGNRYFYKNGQLYSDKQEQTNKTMSSS